jgi:hypothetical protein
MCFRLHTPRALLYQAPEQEGSKEQELNVFKSVFHEHLFFNGSAALVGPARFSVS